MKYSVIIPAYQAEKTISRCLDSLLDQIRNDAEIIVVNDGSTDRTGEICSVYAEKYAQIRYYHLNHCGVSAARNHALEHATGEFIMFVDSDDYVSSAYFSVIDTNLSDDVDFLMFGRAVFDGRTTRMEPLCDHRMANPRDTAEYLNRALVHQQLNALYTKVFRRSIVQERGIRFDEQLPIGEDKVFVIRYIVHVERASFIREPLYTLSVENENSLSRKKRANLCNHILLEHQLLFEAVEQAPCYTDLKKAVSYSYYRSAYTVIRELHKFDYSRRQRLERTRQICRRYAQRRDCTYLDMRHWLLSLPIRWGMAGLIDFLLRKKR